MHEENVSIGAFELECGEVLDGVVQRVTTYGTPQAGGTNVVLVEHALTGSGRAAEWWPAIAGPGGLFDPQRWCVVGINALGGCYGSTGPSSGRFPRVTVRDIVRAERKALERIGIERIAVTIGGSLGGMRALQWALEAPQHADAAVMIGSHDHHSAMGIALNSLQREALSLDPKLGLRLARKLAILTYKSEELFRERHDRRPDRNGKARFDVEGYLEYHGELFTARMNAASYAALTHAMDSFDVRNFGSDATSPRPRLTFVGIAADWLFRPQDVRAAAERFAGLGFDSKYVEFDSSHGHDAFLAEQNALRELLEPLFVGDRESAPC
jgi:homoserine O-acetyltransferase